MTFSYAFCSDFCNESKGIFVLGVFFFLQTNFDFLTKKDFNWKGIAGVSLNLKRYFTP